MTTALLLVLLGLFGLAVGWFLNVLIVRVPAKEPLFSPPSKCPHCGEVIRALDQVPVLSWIALRGRCRSCRESIPAGYPLVEAGSALLWVVAGLRFGASAEVVPYALFFSVLLALSVIDLELLILPDRITLPSIVASAVGLAVLAVVATDNPRGAILGAAIGGVGYAGFLFATLIAFELIVHKEGLGFGDVKLALLLGLWMGWIQPLLIVFALLAACLSLVPVGLAYIVVRRRSMPFPFGPGLALGAIAAIVGSQPILHSYGL